MRQNNVSKSAIVEEDFFELANHEVLPLELQNNALEDDIQIAKQHAVVEGSSTLDDKEMRLVELLVKRGMRLIELRSPPQIDGNLSLGTYYYLQRHVFMIFTDVILALLLGNSLCILQSTALAMDISILSFLGTFGPIYFTIIKCFWHVDGISVFYSNFSIIWS